MICDEEDRRGEARQDKAKKIVNSIKGKALQARLFRIVCEDMVTLQTKIYVNIYGLVGCQKAKY